MKIAKCKLPENSILNRNPEKYDYVDSFRGSFEDSTNKVEPQDIGKAFFTSSPEWVGKLFVLRNKIAAIFGLKASGETGHRQKLLENFKCEPGEQLGLFKVFDRNHNEVVLGEDDKHLNFRVSLFLDKSPADESVKYLTISTCVQFNNWFGRLYFLPVKPLHKVIVPTMLKAIIKDLAKQH